MKRPVRGLVIACALIAGPVSAAQQAPSSATSSSATTSQETIIVTATAAPQRLGNLGRAVDVLTREDIDALPAGSVADLLRTLSSVDVRARGPFGVQTDFSLRGGTFGQTLVLVDGMRMNDAQSGHHNGDIPVPIADIERIEVLRGAGSSLYGADAFGGTINIITRAAQPGFNLDLDKGQHDLFEAALGAGFPVGNGGHRVGASMSRSDGFMPDRDHEVYAFDYRGDLDPKTTIFASHADKEFGAYGFYGPSPSREWTKQTFVRGERKLIQQDRWLATLQAAYRTHGDRFLYDQTRPDLSDNRHRTHAVNAEVKIHHTVTETTEVSVGATAGGDWIRSSALGDHSFARGSGFVEVQQRIGNRVMVYPGLRFDGYSQFGSAWSPSVAASGWLSSRFKWRSSGGHAFRIPTFTDLYYRDPSNVGNPDLTSETAWTADAGVDLFAADGWTASATGFGRWESNVIDYVRASTTDVWRATNVRDVRTHGVETGIRRRFGMRGEAGLQYTWQQVDAPALGTLSKYSLSYAPHTLTLSASAGLGDVSAAPSVQFKKRFDGQEYWLVDLRLSRRLAGRWDIYAEGTNLLNSAYQEIAGVAMPGRWLRYGVRRR